MENYKLEVRAEDWHLTAGLIGFKRLYEDEVETTPAGLLIDKNMLDSLPQRYFDYFLKTYDVAERDYSRMKRLLGQVRKKPETAKDRFTDIKKIMNEQRNKVKRYFEDTAEYLSLKNVVDEAKECKKPEHCDEMEQCIENYYNIMKTEFINEKLTLNYAKSVIIKPFFGQPSFLNVSFNALSLEEQIERMEQDFIKNAKLELQLKEYLEHTQDISEIKEFLEQNSDYKPFKEWLKNVKKMKSIEELKKWFKENVLPCSFIDSLPATMSYEEMMFSPLGVPLNKATNFYWDFNKKIPVPMSALARLILFLFPIGVTFYWRNIGGGDYKLFAGLVIEDDTFSEIYKSNEYYRRLRQEGGSFTDVILGLLDDTRKRADNKLNSYLFVEIYSDYDTKKTLLDYYHMPEYIGIYFKEYGKILNLLYLTEYRDQFVRILLKGGDPKQIIFRYLREAVENEFHAYGAIIAVRERWRVLMLKKGVKNLEEIKKHDNKVWVAFNQGKEIREIFSKVEENTDGIYKASGEKKINGLAYRLLNSVKARNKHAFLDTVFRLHIGVDKKISPIFMEILREEGLDFETIGSAFIAGLLSTDKQSQNEEVKNNG